MFIAIDWDHTITADPGLWKDFIELAEAKGHIVIIVTGRHEKDTIVPPWPMKVVYAGNDWKKDAAERAGYPVIDIWIDDSPGTIEPGKKLIW